MKPKQNQPDLLPVTLDVTLPYAGRRSAVCQAVGQFFEEATRVLLPSDPVRGEDGVVPDGYRGNEVYEVKASGQGAWIVEREQVEAYRLMEQDGYRITYVLWDYRGKPALRTHNTRREIFVELAGRAKSCWVLSLSVLSALLGLCNRKTMGSNGDAMEYWRVPRGLLPVERAVRIPRIDIVIETVLFSMCDVRLVVCPLSVGVVHTKRTPF